MSNVTKPVMRDDTGKSVAQALGNVATAINNMDKVQWGQVKGTLSNQTDLKNNLDSLQGQIDSFTALTPGSTTGDAELTNIRVDSSGHTYNTAGDAVRAIDSQVNAMKTGFDGGVYSSPAAMVQGCDQKLKDGTDALTAVVDTDRNDDAKYNYPLYNFYWNKIQAVETQMGFYQMPAGLYKIILVTKSNVPSGTFFGVSTCNSSGGLIDEDVVKFYNVSPSVVIQSKEIYISHAFYGLRIYTSKTNINFYTQIIKVDDVPCVNYKRRNVDEYRSIKCIDTKTIAWTQCGLDSSTGAETYNLWQLSTDKIPVNPCQNTLANFGNGRSLSGVLYRYSKNDELIGNAIVFDNISQYLLTKNEVANSNIDYIRMKVWSTTLPSNNPNLPLNYVLDAPFKFIKDPSEDDFKNRLSNSSLTFERGNISQGHDEGDTNNIRSMMYTIRGTKITLYSKNYNMFVALYSGNTHQQYVKTVGILAGERETFDISDVGRDSSYVKWYRICFWKGANLGEVPLTYGTSSDWEIYTSDYVFDDKDTYNNPIADYEVADAAIWDGNDGYHYMWHTGRITAVSGSPVENIKRSSDMINWEDTGAFPFDDTTAESIQAWAREKYDNTITSFYAPMVQKIGDKWVLYVGVQWYATICAWSDSPTGPFIWEENSFLVDNSIYPGITYEDPYVVKEINSNKYYLFFGSHGYICRVELDSTGMALASGAQVERVAGDTVSQESDVGNRGEGAFLIRRGKYWYFFFSKGNYNTRANAYHVVVGRAEKLTDDFKDEDGTSLSAQNGGTTILSQNPDVFGYWAPGHNAEIIVDKSNRTFMYYCMYNSGSKNRRLFLQEIKWDNNGWPYFENDGHPKVAGNKAPVL